MPKRFRFDDEDDFYDDFFNDEDYEPSSVKKSSNKSQSNNKKTKKVKNKAPKKKVKKKRGIRPWMVVLAIILALVVAFFVYIFVITNTDGPVYGDRCEGITEIAEEYQTETIDEMKEKYDSIKDMSIEIICKEIKIDIDFNDGMDTDEAKKIARKAVRTLDGKVGLAKENEDDTYSTLLGYVKNVPQYDVSLYLTSSDSEDFPIYATKHHSKQKFSYTYASVKDEESKTKAENTLNDD